MFFVFAPAYHVWGWVLCKQDTVAERLRRIISNHMIKMNSNFRSVGSNPTSVTFLFSEILEDESLKHSISKE